MRPNLAVLRSAIGPMLTEWGQIVREDGTTTDPDTGFEIPNMVTVFDGPVLVRPEDRSLRVAQVGGVSYPVLRFDVTFPAESEVRIGDVLTITESPFDNDLTGRDLTIVDVPLDAWQVARFCVAERR